jgi:CubicO group peptidase (beta-lactamase class C family)
MLNTMTIVMNLVKKSGSLIAVLFLLVHIVSAQNQDQIEHLDAYYSQALKEWNVPGMAVALVKNDEIVFAKGYGYADLEKKTPVDEQTLFAIASNTKAFTATAIAQLVEQGRLNWNDRVRDHLPWFEMADPYVGRKMTVEDLLCHRSGLKTFSGDLLWFGSDKNAREVVEAARHLKASREFRADYGYSNIMYISAGLIIEEVTDTTYTEYIRHHFLDPLQMERTLTSVSAIPESINVATPYFLENKKNIALEWLNWDNVSAAGGLISSVQDMAQWILLNLNKGVWNDRFYFSENSFEKLTTPHISFPINKYTRENQPSKHFRAYGLGWSLHDYHGKKIISHGGGYDGMISKTCLVPESGFGMVVLTNSLNYLPSALMEKTLDVVLNNEMEGTDYADLYLQSFMHNQEEKEAIARNFEEERAKINPKHLPYDKYTGIYLDEMYGQIEVDMQGDNLYFSMKPTAIFKAKLEHWNDHIFTFRFDPFKTSLPPGKLWFELDKNGSPETLLIDVENPDFDFRELHFQKTIEK